MAAFPRRPVPQRQKSLLMYPEFGARSSTQGTAPSFHSEDNAASLPSSNKKPVEENFGQPAKRRKVEHIGGEPAVGFPSSPPVHDGITDAQRARAHHNFLAAKLLQQRAKTPLLPVEFGLSWFEALEREFSKEYFVRLSEFVLKERRAATIYPAPENVFAWTNLFPVTETKVVILGQDPYHGPKQAHGLCFSVPKGVPAPPSLVNIFKEIKTDIPGVVIPSHGNLNGWAEQGVLLLNACLTVRAGCANSHKDQGWELFTDSVITWLNDNLTGVVFLLWGKYAQVKGAKIDKKRHHVLEAAHPSPLSVTRFYGCKHFSKTNMLLEKSGKEPINWGSLGG